MLDSTVAENVKTTILRAKRIILFLINFAQRFSPRGRISDDVESFVCRL